MRAGATTRLLLDFLRSGGPCASFLSVEEEVQAQAQLHLHLHVSLVPRGDKPGTCMAES